MPVKKRGQHAVRPLQRRCHARRSTIGHGDVGALRSLIHGRAFKVLAGDGMAGQGPWPAGELTSIGGQSWGQQPVLLAD